MTTSHRLKLFIVALASALSAQADPVADWTKFDLDKSGKLEGKEQMALMKHERSALYASVDTDDKTGYDGVLSDAELKAHAAAETSKVEEKIKGFAPTDGSPFPGGPLTHEQMVASGLALKPAAPDQEYWPMWGIQIRRNLSDVDPNRSKTRFNAENYAAELKKIKPADFGFAHNDLNGDDSWFARGVIARPFNLSGSDGEGGLFTPSIEFDRVSHSVNKAAEIDSLIFAGTGAWTSNAAGPLDMSQLRFSGQYATDFDFDKAIYGGNVEWEPTFSARWLANNIGQNIPGTPFFYRTRQYLHVEGGGADQPVPDAVETNFFRAGFGSGLVVYFSGALERLSFGADYRYYWDVLGDGDDFHNFRGSAEWRMDDIGHYTLNASYERGLVPLSHQEINLFTISVGIKF